MTDKNFWGVLFMVLILIIFGAMLASCATAPGPSTKISPICEAIGPKFKYNTHNKNSDFHAGPKLAPRLSQQNDVHDGLHCKD